MKALVTGGNSFIGSTLIEELDTLGFEVFAMLDHNASVSNLEGLKFQRVGGSLSDFTSLCRAVEGMRYIFHLEEAESAAHRSELFFHNSQGTERLAQAVSTVNRSQRQKQRAKFQTCSGEEITRFVYLSSLAAGGPSSTLSPKVESEIDQPISDFGLSKLEGEKRLLQFKEEFPVSIIRPAMTYGPRDRMGAWVVQALGRNLMPVLQGSNQEGHKYYSTVHVLDLCRGLVQAAVLPRERVPSGEIFYLSGDGIHTLQELLGVIADHLNCDPLKIRIPKIAVQLAVTGLSAMGTLTRRNFLLNVDKLKEILSDYWICSNQKAKKVLGFVPEFDLASGIAHSVEWYKRQKWI